MPEPLRASRCSRHRCRATALGAAAVGAAAVGAAAVGAAAMESLSWNRSPGPLRRGDRARAVGVRSRSLVRLHRVAGAESMCPRRQARKVAPVPSPGVAAPWCVAQAAQARAVAAPVVRDCASGVGAAQTPGRHPRATSVVSAAKPGTGFARAAAPTHNRQPTKEAGGPGGVRAALRGRDGGGGDPPSRVRPPGGVYSSPRAAAHGGGEPTSFTEADMAVVRPPRARASGGWGSSPRAAGSAERTIMVPVGASGHGVSRGRFRATTLDPWTGAICASRTPIVRPLRSGCTPRWAKVGSR